MSLNLHDNHFKIIVLSWLEKSISQSNTIITFCLKMSIDSNFASVICGMRYLTLSGPGGGSEARMAKLTAANQKPLIL